MKILRKVYELYVKYNLVIGLVLTVLGLWLSFFPINQDPSIGIYYHADDLISLQDSNENLTVLFKGHDIQKEKLNLKVYQITLVNEGRRDVSPEDYDVNIPWGIKFINGYITGYSIAKTSDLDNYILENFFQHNGNDSVQINFKHIIIRPNQRIEFKITVLHHDNLDPKIICFGKIANTAIVLKDGYYGKDGSLWETLQYFSFVVAFLVAFYWSLRLLGFIVQQMKKGIRRISFKIKFGHFFNRNLIAHRLMIKMYSLLGRKRFISLMEQLINPDIFNNAIKNDARNKQLVEDFYRLIDEGKMENPSIKKEEYGSTVLWALDLLNTANLVETNKEGGFLIKREFTEHIETAIKAFKR